MSNFPIMIPLTSSSKISFTHKVWSEGGDLHVEFFADVDAVEVDSNRVLGYLLDDNQKDRKMAMRLISAVEAGKAITLRGIMVREDGSTYFDTKINVWGKYMNTDLQRLGY